MATTKRPSFFRTAKHVREHLDEADDRLAGQTALSGGFFSTAGGGSWQVPRVQTRALGLNGSQGGIGTGVAWTNAIECIIPVMNKVLRARNGIWFKNSQWLWHQ